MTLLYTEPIYLYSHGSGYYSAGDLFKGPPAAHHSAHRNHGRRIPGWVAMFAIDRVLRSRKKTGIIQARRDTL
jgi:hypothetical protein